MPDKVTVAIDAMASDTGFKPLIAGSLDALRADQALKIILVGDKQKLESTLTEKYPSWQDLNIAIEHCEQVVGMGESFVSLARKKGSATIKRTLELVLNSTAHTALSAGSTAASVYWSREVFGTYPQNTSKVAIPIPWPTSRGATILIDAGATVDADAADLAHFGIMGSLYAKHLLKIEKPSVGLLSIGEERTKGNIRAKDAHSALLKTLKSDFKGMIEGNDLARGKMDVVVCDGFLGNIILKLGEGLLAETAKSIKNDLNIFGKLGVLLLLPTLKRIKRKVSWENIGGAPLLGIRGNMVIAHGKSTPTAITNAIRLCANMGRENLAKAMQEKYPIIT
ncbi:phosphate acyltransferase PlsX [Elusimicrobiota bacterium]